MVRHLTQAGDAEASLCLSNIVAHIDDAAWKDVPLRIISIIQNKYDFTKARDVAEKFLADEKLREAYLIPLCWTLSVSGNPEGTIDPLEDAYRKEALGGDWMLFLAHQHARLGNGSRALQIASEVAQRHPQLENETAIERQFFRFVVEFDRRAAQEMLDTIKEKFLQAGIADVEADILRAIELKRPYLLLRLGDGEGSVTRVNYSDTLDNSDYYRANQKEFLKIWFDDESIASDHDFDKVIDQFNEVIGQADCLGGIYQAAIDHEYRLGSRRGIAWIVNIMRKVLDLAGARPDWAARTSVHHLGLHYDLLLSGALGRLLRGRDTIGLITCQPHLAEALKRTYGIREVEFFKIPGEQIHRGSLGGAAVEGTHWPNRFQELCALLDRPADRRGQLFLVAAGMLGKIYAGKLKKSGAVVLDIGAVADLWMGKVTRQFPKLSPEVSLDLDGVSFAVVVAGNWAAVDAFWRPHLSEIQPVVFEPLPALAESLRENLAQARSDCLVFEGVLNSQIGSQTLHLARSNGCSSLAKPSADLRERYSVGSAFEVVRTEDVTCLRYDDLVARRAAPRPDVIEIGLQGTELDVLESFGEVLRSCLGIRMKVYFCPIYDGQEMADSVARKLSGFGFALRKLAPVPNFDGDVVEADAWFTVDGVRAGGPCHPVKGRSFRFSSRSGTCRRGAGCSRQRASDTISGRSVPDVVSPARAAHERSRFPHREAIPQGSPSDQPEIV
ncbi:MAG: FkbM family methyltransferase [Methylobacterium frigidaeris]